jgi:hypothetical protein
MSSCPQRPRLHRHALESVFAWSSLRELAILMRVCREWQMATLSMRSLNVGMALRRVSDSVFALYRSRLACHIGTLSCIHLDDYPSRYLRIPELSALAQNATRLHTLECTLGPGMRDDVLFPSKVTRLDVWMESQSKPSDLAIVLNAVAVMPKLEHFTFRFGNSFADIHLTVLALHPTLRHFVLQTSRINDLYIAEMRTFHSLASIEYDCTGCQNATRIALRKLLRPGHRLQLTTLKLPFSQKMDDQIAALLSFMPSLTHVEAIITTTNLQWIQSLPKLLVLDITLQPASALPSLNHLAICYHMRQFALTTRSPIPVDWLANMLSRVPRITQLWLGMMTLAALPPLPTSLTALTLRGCKVQADQLFPILALHNLQILRVGTDPVLTDDVSAWLQRELPNLQTFRL